MPAPKDIALREAPLMATIRVGPYTFKIDRDEFEAWEKTVQVTAGFNRAAFVAEIRKRLGIDAAD